MTTFVSGRHPVYHLLKAGRRQVRRLYFLSGVEKSEKKITELATRKRISFQIVDAKEIKKKAGEGVNHQGVLAECDEYPYVEFDEILSRGEDASYRLLMLDEIQDPQNVGALCRTAYLFGFQGVILPQHNSASISQGVCHASVGAVEYLKIARVTNFAMTIDLLKEKKFWIYGADIEAAKEVTEENFSKNIVLILGSEEKGMRRLTREKCDILLKIASVPEAAEHQIDSLNASVAGGILMHEIFKKGKG